MKCPSCGAARQVHDTPDMPCTFKGAWTILPQVTGDLCLAFGESILDAPESRRTMERAALSRTLICRAWSGAPASATPWPRMNTTGCCRN
jgi:hypothetical protein